MSYKNKTYIIFDGDEDIWAYAFMKGLKVNEKVEFDFYDAHDINNLQAGSSEETVKQKLRERLRNSKQAIVLVGEKTKNLYRFVRWEIETCIELGIPIVVVNLNNKRQLDNDRCPPLLIDKPVMHVAFKMKIIQYALTDFCGNFSAYKNKVNWFYYDAKYIELGIDK